MNKQQRRELQAEFRVVHGTPVQHVPHPLSPDTRGMTDEEGIAAYLTVRSASYNDLWSIRPGRMGYTADGRDWLVIVATETPGVYGFARATHQEWLGQQLPRRF